MQENLTQKKQKDLKRITFLLLGYCDVYQVEVEQALKDLEQDTKPLVAKAIIKKVRKLLRNGEHIQKACLKVGISTKTYYKLQKQHENKITKSTRKTY